MKHIFLILLITSISMFSQNKTIPFKNGEFLKMELSYGLLSSGFATLELNEINKDNKIMFHVNGNGWTIGLTNFFFPVKDNYQTYFDKHTLQPYRFIRKINEGGHIKNKEIFFDYSKKEALVKNYKHNTIQNFPIKNDIQDMLSSLYYLRSIDFNKLKEGDVFSIKLFYDDSIKEVKLQLKGREVINSNFGKINTLIIKPLVETGRIFKESEGVTIWLTDDENKVPVKVKASILVGYIKAELIEYKNLANKFSKTTSNFN